VSGLVYVLLAGPPGHMEEVNERESVLASIDGWLERERRATGRPRYRRLIPEIKAIQFLDIHTIYEEQTKSSKRYVPPFF